MTVPSPLDQDTQNTGASHHPHMTLGTGVISALVIAILALVVAVGTLMTVNTRDIKVTVSGVPTGVASPVSAAAPQEQIPDGFFALADISKHSDATTSCWVVVDDLVFDLTETSKLHPANFTNCGGDSSQVYHKQHGPAIRDKLLALQIGQVWKPSDAPVAADSSEADAVEAAAPTTPAGCPPENIGGPINPTTTLFAAAGSWDVNQLMLVVEKECRSVVFFDGSTHEEVGRIDDLGHQLHAPTPSPDGSYVYLIARDGWLSKIDLGTLEVVKSIDVGISSRGTGLTDDGKYLLIGNFEPHTATLVDASTLDVLRIYEATGSVNDGPEITSKVGGIVELGSKLYMVLKDVNAVWEIDTAVEGFPVTRRFENLGNGQTPLHDAYMTPEGRYLIASVQGANTIWILDTTTGEVVAEVPTAETPHTGPGATVGNLTFVPTLDPTGVISVVNTDTWTNVKNIDVGGPGLFIRHNPAKEDIESYPYVWAETALGDHHDEIYIIDVRTLEIVKTLQPVVGESSWHPEFTYDGSQVYVVSMTGDAIVVYDATTFEEVTRMEASTPSAVFNIGARRHEFGL